MRLVATSGDQTLSFPLRDGSTIIGRHSSCHICIPASSISRRHCQLYVDGESAILRDLGSANSTYVNGQPIERIELRHGDVIALGNFQLRFEADDGTAPYAAAAPAEPVVSPPPPSVPQQPRQAERDAEAVPGAPAEPYAHAPPRAEPEGEAGVPPPREFAESPELDETPVDVQFVPHPYPATPEAQAPGMAGQSSAPTTALAVSAGVPMQPQLVVRDGRWFLRDPRTGREVEISPKGALAAPPEAGEARRPNTRLLIAGVAAAAVVIIGFAAIFLRPPKVQEDTRAPRELYNRRVDGAVKLLGKGEIKKALAALGRADELRRDIGAARYLINYVQLKQQHADKLAEFPWTDGKRYLESIENVPYPPEEAVAYARRELNWIDRQRASIGRYHEIAKELDQDDSIDNQKVVYEKLRAFPPGTVGGQWAAKKAGEVRAHIAHELLARASAAERQRNWKQAIKLLDDARPYLDDHAQLKQRVTFCQSAEIDKGRIGDGREALRNDRFADARRLFQSIPQGSPYHREAQDLLNQIAAREAEAERQRKRKERQQRIQLAADRYKQGDGPGAVELIQQHGLEAELGHICAKVKSISKLMAEGRKAEDKEEYSTALERYKDVLIVEPDAQNAYHRLAQERIRALNARGPEIAADLVRRGQRKTDESQPLDARDLFQKALKFNPKNEDAKRGLETLQRTAASLYTRGSGLLDRDLPRNALPVLQRARDYAEPGSELHKRALLLIEECKRKIAQTG